MEVSDWFRLEGIMSRTTAEASLFSKDRIECLMHLKISESLMYFLAPVTVLVVQACSGNIRQQLFHMKSIDE